MRPKRVYISGRIKGIEPAESQRRFNEAEAYLNSMGYEAVNPWALAAQRGHQDWGRHVIGDLRELRRCDSIYMLEGWNFSTGANIEWLFARGEGIPEYPLMRQWPWNG